MEIDFLDASIASKKFVGESQWTTVQVGKPNESLVVLEYQPPKSLLAMSSKRNIYKSLDFGTVWEFDRQASRMEYWGIRTRQGYQHLRLILKWFIADTYIRLQEAAKKVKKVLT